MKIKINSIYLILFIITACLFLVFRLPYRSYIYENNIYDFYIADTAPNFFTVFLFVFFKKWQNNSRDKLGKGSSLNITIALATFVGLVIYESFIQQYIYDSTFDVLDILASFIAAILSYVLCQRIDKLDFSINQNVIKEIN